MSLTLVRVWEFSCCVPFHLLSKLSISWRIWIAGARVCATERSYRLSLLHAIVTHECVRVASVSSTFEIANLISREEFELPESLCDWTIISTLLALCHEGVSVACVTLIHLLSKLRQVKKIKISHYSVSTPISWELAMKPWDKSWISISIRESLYITKTHSQARGGYEIVELSCFAAMFIMFGNGINARMACMNIYARLPVEFFLSSSTSIQLKQVERSVEHDQWSTIISRHIVRPTSRWI